MAWLLVVALCLYFFSAISTVVLGILAASIIACTLQPIMAHIPGPRGTDIVVTGVLLLAAAGFIGFCLYWPLATPLSRAFDNWPQMKADVNQTLGRLSTHLGLDEPMRIEKLTSTIVNFLIGGSQQLFSRGADLVLGVLIALAFSLIGSMFLLSENPQRLLAPAARLLPERHRPALEAVVKDLAPRFRRWVIGTIAGMTLVFVASLIGFKSIGFKLAVPMALLAGFGEVVPTVGPATACVIAALFAGASQGAGMLIGVLIVWGAIQAVETYLILPLIMRGAVNIHPAVTLFTVVLWGKIFGIAGLILALPINLTIWTCIEHFRLKPREKIATEEAMPNAEGRMPKEAQMPNAE